VSKDVLVRLQSAAIQKPANDVGACCGLSHFRIVPTTPLQTPVRLGGDARPNGFDPLGNLDHMASLIGEVSGESVAVVVDRLENERLHPGKTVADDFARHGGPRYEWGPHLESFYASTNAFLYELAVWNRNALKRRMRRWVTRHMACSGAALDVLSVGDGLGFDCLHLARKRHRVTYFELPGLGEQFARKLFQRSGYQIPMLTDPARIPLESFDAVTCFDVLEHVPDPPAMVRTLASYLRPGGLLYVSAPFFMVLPWYPTHLRSNRKFSGNLKLYRQAGLRLAGGCFSWLPIVLQKAGGDAPPRGIAETLPVRLAIPFHLTGRVSAWAFSPGHLVRRICNRGFDNARSST
jgi:SAM-dependent methyltransferase